ncbi:MAG: hypothetical protein AB1374_10950 [Bacillota bacterium]
MNCGLEPVEILDLVSDVSSDGRFLENVAIIEISLDDGFKAARLPLQTFGDYSEETSSPGKKKAGKKVNFIPDTKRGMGVPFIRPRAGRPTAPQGKYGVPVYLVFPGEKGKLLTELAASADTFLQGRVGRTLFLPRAFSEFELKELDKLLRLFAAELKNKYTGGGNQGYGLVVLCIPFEGGPYRYEKKMPAAGDSRFVWLGDSVLHPGRSIVADLKILADQLKLSKTEEGAEMGRASRCDLCNRDTNDAVSVYSKAWPWMAPTWHPPFPERFKEGKEVTDLASAIGSLCPDCYTAMVVGAGIFKEVSGVLPTWLTKELFMPVASAGGREGAKKGGQVPSIIGSVVALPTRIAIRDDAELFREALDIYRRKTPPRSTRDRALQAITGFESTLPEDFDSDDYRLSMVYYTQANAEIHMRAVIEDVLPSTVAAIQGVLSGVLEDGADIRQQLGFHPSGWASARYESLPYLLIRAYGGCYLWQTLTNVLHRRTLGWDRFIAGVEARISGYAKSMVLGQGESSRGAYFSLKEEVYFYLIFRALYNGYHKEILSEGGTTLTDWRTMVKKITTSALDEMHFENTEELGFAAGYVVRQFGRQYYARLQKDFMQHRVMTFGSNLSPDDIWRRALSRFQEYALKLNFPLSGEFKKRAAIVECEYRRLREAVQKEKDEFIGAFWSGYMLAVPPEKDEDLQNDGESGRDL